MVERQNASSKKSGVRWSRSHAIRVSSVEHTLVQSESSFSVPPLTMIFCLSGGTPVREKSCILKSAGGWSVSISTGYIPLCHFTWTASRRVAKKKKTEPMRQNKNEFRSTIVPGVGVRFVSPRSRCRGHGVGRSVLPLMTPMVAWLRLDASPPSSLSLSLERPARPALATAMAVSCVFRHILQKNLQQKKKNVSIWKSFISHSFCDTRYSSRITWPFALNN